jgi:hypothetical protein
MINLEIKNIGLTNSSQFTKGCTYDLVSLLKSEHIMEKIADLKNCDEKELKWQLEMCFSKIYTCVKAARQVEKNENFWTDIK